MGAYKPNARPRPPTPNAPNRPSRERRDVRWLSTALLGVLVVGGLVPLAAGAPAGPAATPGGTHVAGAAILPVNSTPPAGTWAWGAAANLSVGATYIGAYNASQTLTGGNLTTSGAFVAVSESAAVTFAVYAIVNVSTPTAGHRYVTVEAAQYQAEALAVRATGTFPVAGSYPPNATVPLTPMNISLVASVASLTAYRAYLNFTTGANGSLTLTDEHVESLRALNVSIAAVNFPNVTKGAGGGLVIRYTTGSENAAAFVAESLTATFAPGVPVVVGPLFVGKSWTATSNVTFRGWAAYAMSTHASSGGSSTGASTSGGASLNATMPVNLGFRVTGTRTVYLPDGTRDTDFVIAYHDGIGSGGVLLANGLLVLPSQDPTKSGGLLDAVPEHPAAAPLAATLSPGGASLYSPRVAMVAGEQATPSGTNVVTAGPESPEQASASIHALGHPVPPVSVAPASNGLPALALAVFVVGGIVGGVALVRHARRSGVSRG